MDDHADRIHHIQPRLSRPRELRFRVGRRHQSGPRHQQGTVVVDRRVVLPRLFLLSASRRDLRGTPQREKARVLEPDPVGRMRGADRHGQQYSLADGDPLRARRRRSRGDAGDADFHQQLVHEERALAGQHLPDSRQSGDGAVDVGGIRLSGALVRLAPHVHRRRRARDHLGGVLVVHRAGQAAAGIVAHPAAKGRPRRNLARRTGRDQAGAQLQRSVPHARGHQAVCAVFLLEYRRVWFRAVAAVDPEERFDARHGRNRLALGAAVSGRNDRHACGFVGIG